MDQRIKHATDLALKEHPYDSHIYFVSGYKNPEAKEGEVSEAEYMENKIRGIYRSKGRAPPRIVADYQAKFTVMNFLMTIPMINQYRNELRKVYMVTSDYHMCRSEAILKAFKDADLTRDVKYVPASARHPTRTEHGFDDWLLTPCGNRTRLEDIKDPSRDADNAGIFADLIVSRIGSMPALVGPIMRWLVEKPLIDRYLNNNKAFTSEKKIKKTGELNEMVATFIETY